MIFAMISSLRSLAPAELYSRTVASQLLYGKYHSMCGSCSLFNYSTLLLQHKGYKNKWVWPSSNKYLWTHIQISYNFHVIKYFLFKSLTIINVK